MNFTMTNHHRSSKLQHPKKTLYDNNDDDHSLPQPLKLRLHHNKSPYLMKTTNAHDNKHLLIPATKLFKEDSFEEMNCK